jgi:cysteine desulfurase
MRPIYLDYNATTPIAPAALEAMQPFLVEQFGNPSSDHVLGRAAHQAVEDARMQVAELLGANFDEIVFTSGGTESNNLALKGSLLKNSDVRDRHVIISAIEHPAIVEPARYLTRLGCELSICRCDSNGIVPPSDIASLLRPHTALVSVMHANNEIGTIQPIREIAEICHERSILFHTDAAQSVGKIPVQVGDLQVDLLSLAGHKLYAPKGVGALYVRRGITLEPVLHGASHERKMRAGTENVPYIVGLGAVAKHAGRDIAGGSQRLAALRDRLHAMLHEEIGSDITVNGYGVPGLPNTLSVNFPRISGHELLSRVPELCASTGSACHSGRTTPSPTLAAIGLPPEKARGTVRLSVGWPTSEDEVETAGRMLIDAWKAGTR